MNRKFLAFVAVALVATLGALPVHAAYDAFLNFGDIKGESTDKDHKDWVEIDSFSLGALRTGPSAAGAPGSARVNLSEIKVTKVVDKASPKLMQAWKQKRSFPTVILECRKAGGTQMEYLKYVLENVTITGMSSGGDRPTESLSLNFTKIEYAYAGQQHGTGAIRSQVSSSALASAAALTPQITKLTATPTSGFVPLTVNFSAEGIGTCQNGVLIDWGDGTIPEVQFSIVSGKGVFSPNQPTLSHTYSRAGVFAARAWGINDPNRPRKDPRQHVWPNGCIGYQTVNVTVQQFTRPAQPVVR